MDTAMREQLEIDPNDWRSVMDVEHHLALNVELHEFINACFKPWKYWKRKDMNMDDVLDEAIDVIHFSMLLINKNPTDTLAKSERIARKLQDSEELKHEIDVRDAMFNTSTSNNSVAVKLVRVLQILDYYGFTTQDILSAYNNKNKVNFERLNNGY